MIVGEKELEELECNVLMTTIAGSQRRALQMEALRLARRGMFVERRLLPKLRKSDDVVIVSVVKDELRIVGAGKMHELAPAFQTSLEAAHAGG